MATVKLADPGAVMAAYDAVMREDANWYVSQHTSMIPLLTKRPTGCSLAILSPRYASSLPASHSQANASRTLAMFSRCSHTAQVVSLSSSGACSRTLIKPSLPSIARTTPNTQQAASSSTTYPRTHLLACEVRPNPFPSLYTPPQLPPSQRARTSTPAASAHFSRYARGRPHVPLFVIVSLHQAHQTTLTVDSLAVLTATAIAQALSDTRNPLVIEVGQAEPFPADSGFSADVDQSTIKDCRPRRS